MNGLFDPSSYRWTWFAVPPLTVGVLAVFLGLLVIWRERGSRISLVFNLVSLHLSLWLVTRALIFLSGNPSTALFWVKTGNFFVVLIPSSAVIYTLFLLRRLRRQLRLAFLCLAFSLLSILTIIFTGRFTSGVYHHPWGYATRYGSLSYPFLIFFFVSLMFSLHLYWREYRRAPAGSLTKLRLKSYSHGLAVALLASVDFLETYGFGVYPFGYLPILVFLILMVRSFWRYRLVNITPSIAAEQIIKTLADALIVVDREGVIRVVNDAASEIFGRPSENLIDRPSSLLEVPLLQKNKISWMLWDKKLRRDEVVYRKPDGGERVFEIKSSVVEDIHKISVAAIFIIKDITAGKQAQQKLLESEQQYRLLAENVRDVIWTTDRDLQFTYISPSMESLTGFGPQEAMKHVWKETLAPASYDAVMRIFKKAREYNELTPVTERVDSETLELEYRRKNEKTVWTEAQITFLRDAEDRLTHILGVTRDITERRQSRRMLQSLEHHYDELIQAIGEPILTLDRMGYLRRLNPAAEKMLGYSQLDLHGKHFSKAGLFLPQSSDKLLQEVTLVLLGWQRSPIDVLLISKDQMQLTMEAATRLVERSNGESHVAVQLRLKAQQLAEGTGTAEQKSDNT